ncbi:hypothetical protein JTB14_001691 [Gonioctena quinquepunctata]|nr:hypothetical protein JTB14_001691 [Gonioctena quinquepunctata]
MRDIQIKILEDTKTIISNHKANTSIINPVITTLRAEIKILFKTGIQHQDSIITIGVIRTIPNPRIEIMWTIEPITNHRMATQTIASSSFQIQEQWTDDQGATHAEGLGTSPQRVGIGKLTTQTPTDATISPRCRLPHKWDH